MKAALLLIGLLTSAPSQDDETIIRSFTPECGATHCQLTLEQHRGVVLFQQTALATIRSQADEIERLRRGNCSGRGS